jgi:uncharacterized protein YdiU (UPF0061 family)
MLAANPADIPRNHRVEEVIRATENPGDFAPFKKLHRVLQRPYDEQESDIEYQKPPWPEEIVQVTYCGT